MTRLDKTSALTAPSWQQFQETWSGMSEYAASAPAGGGYVWTIYYDRDEEQVEISLVLEDPSGSEIWHNWIVRYDFEDTYYDRDYRDEALEDAWETHSDWAIAQVSGLVRDASVKTSRSVEWDNSDPFSEEESLWDVAGGYGIGGVSTEGSAEGFYWWTDDGEWKDGFAPTFEQAQTQALNSVPGLNLVTSASKHAFRTFTETVAGEDVTFIADHPDSPFYSYQDDDGDWVVEDLDSGEAIRLNTRDEAIQALTYRRDHGSLPSDEAMFGV